MKTRDSDHPLAIWLENQGEAAHTWARQNNLGIATIYNLMRGRLSQMPTLIKIENATSGGVSVAQMVNWYAKNTEDTEESYLP